MPAYFALLAAIAAAAALFLRMLDRPARAVFAARAATDAASGENDAHDTIPRPNPEAIPS